MKRLLILAVCVLSVFLLFFVNLSSNVSEASAQIVPRTLKGRAGMYHLLTFPTRFIPYRTLDNNLGAPNVPIALIKSTTQEVLGTTSTDGFGEFSITADMDCRFSYLIQVTLPINVPGGTFQDVISIPINTSFCSEPYEHVTILGHELRWAGAPLGPFAGEGSDEGWGNPSCKIRVGLPVNVTNGNMYLSHTDYILPGKGDAIDITRSYNSASTKTGIFGSGWATKYDENLTIHDPDTNSIRLSMSDGRAVYFERADANSPYLPATEGFYAQIALNTDGTHTVTFQDGRKHHFSSSGKLLWLKDRNGFQTTLAYTSGNLSSITDAFGRVLTVTMNSGQVTQISDSLGAVATYSYNTDETLDLVTYPDGSKYEFEYETVGGRPVITEVKDALGNLLEGHEYDSQGRAITSEKDGGIEKFTLEYVDFQTTVVTDALERTTTYVFNNDRGRGMLYQRTGGCGCGNGAQSETYFYDGNLNVIKEVDALGRHTTYTYDDNGNVLTKTTPIGTATYTYNAFSQVLTIEDAMGGIWTNTYDTDGNLLTTTDPLNHTSTITYTSLGLPETVTDARNNTTTFDYDSSGRLEQVTDADGNETDFDYDARARITSVTNALNETTEFEYDTRNRLKKVTNPDSHFISYGYDTAGRRTSVTDERGHTSTFVYDDAYRLREITDALSHTTTLDYDLMSNMTSRTDALGNITDMEYDNFNRLKKVIYPPAFSEATRLEESYAYDEVGNVTKKTDTAGRETNYRYDIGNRMDRITDALNYATNFTYNARSQMTKIKDALNNEYTFTYDALGRKLSQTRANTTMSYEYDENGNLSERTDHNGQVTNYTYDVLDRLTNVVYAGSANYAVYAYDDLSRLTSAENQNGTVSTAYDNRGRVVSVTDVFGHVVEYAYDAAGNRIRLDLDSNTHTSYAYDEANRLTTLTDEFSNDYTFAHDAVNRLITKTLPNDVVTTYTYDGMSRLTNLKHDNSSGTLFDNQYGYNSANQIDQIGDLTQTRDFSYDFVDRLTDVSASSSPLESYAYDSVGNRTAYTHNPFNRTMAANGIAYTYDNNGNRSTKRVPIGGGGPMSTDRETTDYDWDEENRLVSLHIENNVNSDQTNATYKYDALGRRIKKTVADEETQFIYDGEDVVKDMVDPGDFSIIETYYQNGRGIDKKLRVGASGYVLEDHLGSTLALTKASGSIIDSTEYDSFGNATNPSFPTRYQFTGREFESASGLQYSRARWYDPQIGRFISEDPIGFGGGDINLYGYVGNNPQNRIDPSGNIALPFLFPNKTPEDECPKECKDEEQEIRNAFEESVRNMTERGQRMDPAALNGIQGTYAMLTGGTAYLSCYEQACALINDLKPKNYANYSFELEQSTIPFTDWHPHSWVRARPVNPKCKSIKLDPWKNRIGEDLILLL